MTAHSHGHWRCGRLVAASSAEPDDPPVCLITNDAGDILAEVWKPMNPATNETTLANGTLLAAAPQLLIQALRLDEFLQSVKRGRFNPSVMKLDVYLSDVQSAIAQATCQAVQP